MNPGREARLRDEIVAVTRNRAFALVYQPIVHLDAGTMSGLEALCRFHDEAPTERRFQQAERLGLASDLDLAIIETVLIDLPRLEAEYASINLSPSTLLDERLAEVLLAPGVPTDRLVIEVTEHARITDYEAAERQLAALRTNGIRLAVDDAGAGYATFRHILSLRPDIIKMDRSITQDIDTDAARQALTTALVIFGAELGATVIAEGVQTRSEVVAVRRAGIQWAQGYSLAEPQAPPIAPLSYTPPPLAELLDLRETENEGEHDQSLARRRLQSAVEGLSAAQAEVTESVVRGRSAGMSWDETARILGMTRQGASKRYGRGRHP